MIITIITTIVTITMVTVVLTKSLTVQVLPQSHAGTRP